MYLGLTVAVYQLRDMLRQQLSNFIYYTNIFHFFWVRLAPAAYLALDWLSTPSLSLALQPLSII